MRKMIRKMLSIFLVLVLAFSRENVVVGAAGEDGILEVAQWYFSTSCYEKYIYLYIRMHRTDVELTGFEIYRAPIKENGKKGTFKKIKTLNKIQESEIDREPYWEAQFRDRNVVFGKSYAYKVMAYKQSGNVKTYISFSPVRKCSYVQSWGYTRRLTTKCKEKSILLHILFSRSGIKPTSFEVYRAPIKKNGKKGNYQKIKTIKKIWKTTTTDSEDYWEAEYEDFGVTLGKSYAYKVRGYKKIGNKKVYSAFSSVRKGACGSDIGQYDCKIIKSTSDELILKLTGKKGNKNGPLTIGPTMNGSVILAAKTGEEGKETVLHLYVTEISLDGKKWYGLGENGFTIRNRESIYLYLCDNANFSDNPVGPYGTDDIGLQGYTHVQAMLSSFYYREKRRYVRANLITGNAEAGNFRHREYENDDDSYVYEWEGDEFTYK